MDLGAAVQPSALRRERAGRDVVHPIGRGVTVGMQALPEVLKVLAAMA